MLVKDALYGDPFSFSLSQLVKAIAIAKREELWNACAVPLRRLRCLKGAQAFRRWQKAKRSKGEPPFRQGEIVIVKPGKMANPAGPYSIPAQRRQYPALDEQSGPRQVVGVYYLPGPRWFLGITHPGGGVERLYPASCFESKR
jgi:hypothetical protein